MTLQKQFDTSVLHLYKTYFPDPPGGMQEAIRQICFSTQEFGVKNSIYTLSKTPAPKIIDSLEAKVFRGKSWLAPASCDIGFAESFREYGELSRDSDIVCTYHPWPFADLLNFRKPRKLIVNYVSDVVRQKYINKAYEFLLYRTLEQSDIVVANCVSYANTSKVLTDKRFAEKIRVLPLGIDEKYYSNEEDISIMDGPGMRGNEPYLLFIGVLRYYKGLDYLLEASKKTNRKIVIAGAGPEEDRLKKRVALECIGNVVFLGRVTDPQKIALIKGCTALVLPSHLRSEAYGMVLVEASMHSKPMISCEIGTGTSFINLHGETGIVIKPGNSSELAKAIEHIFSNEESSSMMGKAARSRYENYFSGSIIGKAYSDLYRELAAT